MSRRDRRAIVPPSTHAAYAPGERCTNAGSGDLVLVRHASFMGRAIRTACRLRRPRGYGLTWREWWRFCWTNHACVVVGGGPAATVVQATASGLVVSPLSAFDGTHYAVVKPAATPEQRQAAVTFALWSVGCGYGFLQIPADLWNAATGFELSLGIGDRMVCSTASARTHERLGLVPHVTPDAVTPPHLALYYGVEL